jgi:hypothetical protein
MWSSCRRTLSGRRCGMAGRLQGVLPARCTQAGPDLSAHCIIDPSPLLPTRSFLSKQAALDKLPGELKAQQANAAAVEGRLQREKGGWVAEGPQARALLPREFAQASASGRILVPACPRMHPYLPCPRLSRTGGGHLMLTFLTLCAHPAPAAVLPAAPHAQLPRRRPLLRPLHQVGFARCLNRKGTLTQHILCPVPPLCPGRPASHRIACSSCLQEGAPAGCAGLQPADHHQLREGEGRGGVLAAAEADARHTVLPVLQPKWIPFPRLSCPLRSQSNMTHSWKH